MRKRLIVLSFDALSGQDMAYMKRLPVFQAFFARAAICTNVRSIYPSVTYPCHVSIVTGKHPRDHGVTANVHTQPKRANTPDWYWQAKYVKAPTIYDLAIQKGMKVGAFLWPVTAKSNIHYLLPEIFANRAWDTQLLTSLRNGSPLLLLRFFRQFGHMLKGISQPELDDFVTACVIDTIRQKSPELLFVHLTDIDAKRHQYGVHSAEAYAAIDRHAIRFERILDALKEKQLYDSTNIVILGDHTQLDFHTKVALNEILAEHGWQEHSAGKVISWKAFAKSNGGSAYLYQKTVSENTAKLHALLKKLQEDPKNGIERILTSEEAAAEGADPACTFMLEAKEGYLFTDAPKRHKKAGKADHGYHPSKPNFRTFYAMAGPDIRQGVKIDRMSLLDIAPTLAKLLDLPFESTDGTPLDIFLQESDV